MKYFIAKVELYNQETDNRVSFEIKAVAPTHTVGYHMILDKIKDFQEIHNFKSYEIHNLNIKVEDTH